MHSHNLESLKHKHHFNRESKEAEKNTHLVIWITVVMMVGEIIAGITFGSMALLADGWHMGTHAAALGITAFAYFYARKHANNPRYSFGTGKVGVLGGFASAVSLAVVALLMGVGSAERFLNPIDIQFNHAIGVAILGLLVNLFCAYLLKGDHHHHHGHGHHEHDHHHDHNLKAAYLHVVADALTSLLAIVALICGKSMGWVWMDPAMGLVGAIVISKWSYNLLKETSQILLDSGVAPETLSQIRETVEGEADNRIVDLHVWPVGSNSYAGIVSVVTHFPKPPEHYKKLLDKFNSLSHITVEVLQCEGEPCMHPV